MGVKVRKETPLEKIKNNNTKVSKYIKQAINDNENAASLTMNNFNKEGTGFRTYIDKKFPWFRDSTEEPSIWKILNEYEGNNNPTDASRPSRARHMSAASNASDTVADKIGENKFGKYLPDGLRQAIGDTTAFTAGLVNEQGYPRAIGIDGFRDATTRLVEDIGANYSGSFGTEYIPGEASGEIFNRNYEGMDALEYKEAMEDFKWYDNFDKNRQFDADFKRKLYNKGLLPEYMDEYYKNNEMNIWKQFSK
jgi:hypothetical protein